MSAESMRGAATLPGAAPARPARDRRPLYALLVAWVTTLVGRQLSTLAVPWLVLTTTGSAGLAGVVGAVAVVPSAIAGLFGGVLIDRLGAHRIAILANVVSAAGIVLVPLLHVTVGLAFWQLLIAVFIGSMLEIPAITAGRAMVPEIAALARQPLERVNAAFESMQNLSLLLGPPAAGVLIAVMGPYHVLWLDAAASMAGAVILALFVPAVTFARRAAVASAGLLADLAAGWHFIRRDPVLWPMAVILSLSNMTSIGLFGIVLPYYAEDVLESPTALGVVLAAVGVGLLVGSSLYGVVAGRIPRRPLWVTAFMTATIMSWVLLLEPGVLPLAAAAALCALFGGPLNPMMVTIRVERSPAELRGRVFSTYSTIAMATQPIGLLVIGAMVDGLGFFAAVLALAVVGQAIGLATLILPGFRSLGPPVPTSAPEPAHDPNGPETAGGAAATLVSAGDRSTSGEARA